MLNAIVIATVLGTGFVLWSPRLRQSIVWRAMTTPLASIIGSGFLVLGPILDASYGMYAPLVMAGLCIGSYLFGSVVRYNIKTIADGERSRFAEGLEMLASWCLGFAYIISVAYYLNLFGAFSVSLTTVNDTFHARLLTSAILILILYVGWTRGFRALEGMEYVSVSAKLAIIAGLLVALAVFFFGKSADGALVYNEPALGGMPALLLAFGLIITVQGFETSRYLGAEYDFRTRIVSMRWAQIVTTVIYMIYILLLVFLFESDAFVLTETAIVDMMSVIAPILPVLLVAAALAAQFSAAVADTSGSGGLFAELTQNRITPQMAYVLLTLIGLALTWTANIFEIITYASRAFAAYYAIQSMIALVSARRVGDKWWRTALFAALTVLGIAIAVFGQSVEN
ncbi:hypothetical protein K1W69_15320 [Hoeflea sp. WL0058]|uniref:Uncharacterized protein n=1 Tax=Flavimaribacter sediminis TaxID=2865987 RepID=A0AAE2ZPM6_9HYPH|nr:hypothetical protein [Flavimaribacter sediminis]MBW8638566.1 hypothetical protein [Flavimaribacter sediminis]